ncbi:MAG: phosphopentomutase [Oscillospiraceae bacterium]|nr:phosphopentomutase [Oscillospiraceae bacterium]
MKRVFLIVLDSVGCGALPDADLFGDEGTNTLRSCYNTGILNIPNMQKMGIGNIEGLSFLGETANPTAAVARLREKSMGKDTTTGHWEMAGIVSNKPMPTFPNGFSEEILNEFSEKTDRGVLCNLPYSGTDVIRDYGEEHIKTGKLIVYTSADSVFQIAAHTDVVPLEELYEDCRIARKILTGDNAVGRVIARPFTGKPGNFTRTADRKDFSLEPTSVTMLDALKASGKDVIAVGKITDIFAARGITKSLLSHGNPDCMRDTIVAKKMDFEGLAFTNLVDFDMVYGHRNNAVGYATALNEFDSWLGGFVADMKPDDILMITADHGCDPGDVSTDHSREYVPLIVYGKKVNPVNMGTLQSFTGIASTVCDYFNVESHFFAESFLGEILKEG